MTPSLREHGMACGCVTMRWLPGRRSRRTGTHVNHKQSATMFEPVRRLLMFVLYRLASRCGSPVQWEVSLVILSPISVLANHLTTMSRRHFALGTSFGISHLSGSAGWERQGGNGKGVVAASRRAEHRASATRAGRCAFCLGSMQRNATHTHANAHTRTHASSPSYHCTCSYQQTCQSHRRHYTDPEQCGSSNHCHAYPAVAIRPPSPSRSISLRRPRLLPCEEDPSRTQSTWSRRLRRGSWTHKTIHATRKSPTESPSMPRRTHT